MPFSKNPKMINGIHVFCGGNFRLKGLHSPRPRVAQARHAPCAVVCRTSSLGFEEHPADNDTCYVIRSSLLEPPNTRAVAELRGRLPAGRVQALQQELRAAGLPLYGCPYLPRWARMLVSALASPHVRSLSKHVRQTGPLLSPNVRRRQALLSRPRA